MKHINKPGIKMWNALMLQGGNRHGLCVTVEFEMLLAPYRKCLLHNLMVTKHTFYLQGGSNMTGTDLYVNKPHYAAAVRP